MHLKGKGIRNLYLNGTLNSKSQKYSIDLNISYKLIIALRPENLIRKDFTFEKNVKRFVNKLGSNILL